MSFEVVLLIWLLPVLGGAIQIYTAWTTWQSRRRSRLAWSLWPKSSISEKPGQPPKSPSVSRLRIWNIGARRLEWVERSTADPPRIQASGAGAFIDARVVMRTEMHTGLEVVQPSSDGRVLITFEYLEPQDGAVIEIDHEPDATINFLGAFRDVKEPTYVPVDFLGVEHPDPRRRAQQRNSDLYFNALQIIGPGFYFVLLHQTVGPASQTVLAVLCGFSLLSAIVRMIVHRRLYPPIPKALYLPETSDLPELFAPSLRKRRSVSTEK